MNDFSMMPSFKTTRANVDQYHFCFCDEVATNLQKFNTDNQEDQLISLTAGPGVVAEEFDVLIANSKDSEPVAIYLTIEELGTNQIT